MRKTLPKVSFIIPLYNAEKYIAETLESVLGQTYQNFEVIVVDDCGQDSSVSIVEQFEDDRIKLIHNDRNRGIAYSRNIALENATGEFIALLDDDDVAISTRLEKQIAFLLEHPEIGAVGGNAQWIDAEGEIVRDVIEVVEDPETIKMFLLFRNLFNNSEMTFRAEIARNNHIEYSDGCYGLEDYLFWVKFSQVTKFGNIPDLVLKKRVVHTNETSRARSKKGEERRQKYLEIQKYSLGISGFTLTHDDEKVLENFFDEKAKVCKTLDDIEQLTAFLSRIIEQAQSMHASFCEPLENWFGELLEWNIENFKSSYLKIWRESVCIIDSQEDKRTKEIKSDKMFSTDLVKLKEMSARFEEREKYIQELLHAKQWLENQQEEQEKYIQKLQSDREWDIKHSEEQEKYIQKLQSDKEWDIKHSEEQEKYIQELQNDRDWYERHNKEQEDYIQELLKGKEWLEKHSNEQENYIKSLLCNHKASNQLPEGDK